MIATAYRFHGYGGLRFVYRKGRTVRTASVALRYAPNDRQRHYRLAVVVGRKVNKSAVVRNRIRRRLYEAARLQLNDLHEPHDLVLTVFSDRLATADAAEITTTVCQLLAKAGLIKTTKSSPGSL